MNSLVLPPDRRLETLNVIRVSVAIIVIGLLTATVHTQASSRQDLRPYQVLFTGLPEIEQGVYLELSAMVGDIMWLQEENARWPTIAELADEGLSVLQDGYVNRRRGGHTWTSMEMESGVRYLGLPETGSALMLEIQTEDGQGKSLEHFNMIAPDQEHYLLDDGNVIHVYYWIRDAAAELDIPWEHPAMNGWRQVVLPRSEP
jgi:hypothetical protein